MKGLIFIAAIITLAQSARVRIIQGTVASDHEFPYQVSLQWNYNNGSRPTHFCSGSILNPHWILTAAHCEGDFTRVGWTEVVAGVNNIAIEDSAEQRRNVSRFVQHERYNPMMLQNDIAVLRLSQPLHLNDRIKTITLATGNSVIVDDTIGKFAGWGSISDTWEDVFPDELMKIDIALRSLEDCQRARPTYDVSKEVCVGGYRNVTGCTADSGGPLTVQINDSTVQIGVLSYGEKPCKGRLPIIFMRVAHYYEWIQRKIEKKIAKRWPWGV
ncbi:trypsin-2-like [Anopheles albimanus]|uniref:trypsin-2-like n=1 Tax=Anopheles albimanus TaxID=7167 RepID=UPI0016400A81|nr:trypsin-2-like [Anopheles albimanus]